MSRVLESLVMPGNAVNWVEQVLDRRFAVKHDRTFAADYGSFNLAVLASATSRDKSPRRISFRDIIVCFLLSLPTPQGAESS